MDVFSHSHAWLRRDFSYGHVAADGGEWHRLCVSSSGELSCTFDDGSGLGEWGGNVDTGHLLCLRRITCGPTDYMWAA